MSTNTPTDAPTPRVVLDTTTRNALSAPFDPREIKFKPQAVKNNRALAIAYVDVRLVEDRLDEVLGVENWQDDYEILADGSVACRLRLYLGGQWVTKMDVGSPSEQPDGGDRMKAAFSDALKRAAVKWGIGRYLYRLPAQWVDYDPVKKQIVAPPQLPAFAVPKVGPRVVEAVSPPVAVVNGKPATAAVNPVVPAPTPTPTPAPASPAVPPADRLQAFQALMVRKGQKWATVMLWLAKRVNVAAYTGETKFGEVPEQHLKQVEGMLEGLADVVGGGAGSGGGSGSGVGLKKA